MRQMLVETEGSQNGSLAPPEADVFKLLGALRAGAPVLGAP
jgi:hypothetical protein